MGRASRAGAPARALANVVCLRCQEVLTPTEDRELTDDELTSLRDHEQSCVARVRRWQVEGYIPTSYSALSSFHYCPAEYAFGLEDKDEGNNQTRMGHVLHAYAENGRLEAGNDLRLGMDAEFWKMVTSLDSEADTVTERTLFEQELFWEVPVTVKDGTRYVVQVRGFIDRLDIEGGLAVIKDYKTGRMIDYGSWEQQRALYSVLVARNYPEVWRGVRAVTMPLRFLGKEKSKGMWNQWTLVDIERESMLIEQKLQSLAQAHHDKQFTPRPETNRCRLCEYAHKCDAAQRRLADFKLELPVIHRHIKRKGRTEEEIEVTEGTLKIVAPGHVASDKGKLRQLGAAAWQLQAVLDSIKAVLKEATKTEKLEIPEAGGAWAHWESSSTRIRDIDAAIQRCIELDIPLSEVLSWNSQTGAKYVRDHEELEELAETVPSRYPRFEFRKFREDA